MSMFELLLVGMLIFLGALVRLLPRFSTYVVGPGILVFAAMSFVKYKPLFFPFQSDGSAAGMIVPVLAWGALLGAGLIGIVVILAGRKMLALAAQSDA